MAFCTKLPAASVKVNEGEQSIYGQQAAGQVGLPQLRRWPCGVLEPTGCVTSRRWVRGFLS